MSEEAREMLDDHQRARPSRSIAYFLLAAGGLILEIDPFRQLESIDVWTRWVWTSLIVVPALASGVSALVDRWFYELVAIPFVMAGFSGLVWVLVAGGGSTARWAFAFWLAAIVEMLRRRMMALVRFVQSQRRLGRGG